MSLLDYLVELLKVESSLSEVNDAELIVPISYVTKRDGLTCGTERNLIQAIKYRKELCPGALIAFSNCRYPFWHAELDELHFKVGILKYYGICDYIVADAMNNSVQEALQIKRKLSFIPRKILLITGEMHSRSACTIWKRVFPKTKIIIRCTDYKYEYQHDHPVNVQRGAYRWFIANQCRLLGFHLLGLNLQHFHHRAN